MAQSAGNVSWWIVPLPAVITSIVMFVVMWITMRQRRWQDWRSMAKAATMPTEHVTPEPRTVRDMVVGEESFVDSYAVVTSEKKRVFCPLEGKP